MTTGEDTGGEEGGGRVLQLKRTARRRQTMMAGEKRGQGWEKETGAAETGDGDGCSGNGG